MAANPETSDDYVDRLNRETRAIEAEARRLMAEVSKMHAERSKALAKETWLERLAYGHPALFFAFSLALGIAIMALGAVLAKKFLM